ncbi:hypothetical protein G3V71_24050, partial [Escherichia coli]|nr:hypothetical protein [Escherichia coli]
RHTLANASTAPFTGQSLLGLSEIGVAAQDVGAAARDAQASIRASPYRWSGSPEFMPLGDEQGLLIFVHQGRVWYPDTGVEAARLPVTVTVRNEGETVTLSFA